MNLTLAQIEAAVDAAMSVVTATRKPTAKTAIGDNAALAGFVYNGPKGAGYYVEATVTIQGIFFVFAKQCGPDTSFASAINLADVQARVIQAKQTAYQAAINSGYADTALAITLSITDDSITQIHRLDRLLSLTGIAPTTAVSWGDGTHQVNGLLDINNVPHPMIYSDFLALMQRMGAYVSGLKAKLFNQSAAVMQAASVDAVAQLSL